MTRSYKINGISLPTPDEDVEITEEDMHDESWRDGAGKLHLVVIRRGVIKVPLTWSYMTESEFQTLKNACRKDMTGTYTFEDLFGNTYQIYTGADLKYSIHVVNKDTGEALYKDVKLSFIEL